MGHPWGQEPLSPYPPVMRILGWSEAQEASFWDSENIGKLVGMELPHFMFASFGDEVLKTKQDQIQQFESF